jgi:NAD-dependent dihydropyrimidine dehydrogenase PreA subunit
MKINSGCIRCKSCIPYCPVAAILIEPENNSIFIDQEECVECGVCLNAGICPVNAIYQPELVWPRTLRAKWSSVVYVHPETNIKGRGTDEMKTNDVTGRFRQGEVGFGVELGRPSTGTKFVDVEKVTLELAKHEVAFEQMNPLTGFIDKSTGKFLDTWHGYPLDNEFRKTKVMTVIIEFKVKQEKMIEVIRLLEDLSEEIDTVMSIDLISKCTQDGQIPVKKILEKEGIGYYINGKTNVGLACL